ncbi:MAG: hypothetical protein K9H65_03860 [Bacteroidales bacterium]|nr:hypothetical protein [Bacteroidales bacterium]
MKKLFYFLILTILPVFGYSQIYQPLPNFYSPIDSSVIHNAKDSNEDKVDFGLTVGTGFTSFSGHSMMNSYVAPSIDYQVNSNFSLNFTGVISNFNQSPFSSTANFSPSGDGLMPMNTSNNSYAISAGGTYQPNDRMYISAQGQHAENSMAPFSLYPDQNNRSFDYNSFSLGMGYKISENASIDFEFRFSEGNNPFYTPYNRYNSFDSFNRNRFYW